MIQLTKINRRFELSEESNVLNNISLNVGAGEIVSVMGPSGSGKSTLLYIIGLMDRGFSGEYLLSGHDVSKMDENEIAILRNRMIGFVFQNFNLIGEMTALENVMLSLDIFNLALKHKDKISKRDIKMRSRKALVDLGLEEHMYKKPGQLSGGQQQRVSIARCLVKNPDIILADEPTGALDQKNGKEIMRFLCQLKCEGKTVIVVTHDKSVSELCDRQINILDGCIFPIDTKC